jgi:hypothetical protein
MGNEGILTPGPFPEKVGEMKESDLGQGRSCCVGTDFHGMLSLAERPHRRVDQGNGASRDAWRYLLLIRSPPNETKLDCKTRRPERSRGTLPLRMPTMYQSATEKKRKANCCDQEGAGTRLFARPRAVLYYTSLGSTTTL